MTSYVSLFTTDLNMEKKASSLLIGTYSLIAYGEEIEAYCKKHFRYVGFLGIVNPFTKTQARATLWGNGVKKTERCLATSPIKAKYYAALFPITYLFHFFQLILSARSFHQRFEYYLGIGYFCAFVGIFLRALKITDKVIYYVYDYFPPEAHDSFRVRIIKFIFRFFDSWAYRQADHIWCLSEPLAAIYRSKISNRTVRVVPLGIAQRTVESRQKPIDQELHLAFIGSIKYNQCLEMLLEVMAQMRDRPHHFHIIGGGAYQKEVKEAVERLQLTDKVTMYGFIEHDDEIHKILSQAHFGIALFSGMSQNDFSLLTDIGKLKLYFSYHLPVITDERFVISRDINQYHLGYAISSTKQALESLLRRLYTISSHDYLKMRENVQAYTSQNSFDAILSQAFHASKISHE